MRTERGHDAHVLWPFVGRDDVFAQQLDDGSYAPVRRALTSEDLQEHLAGQWSIGTYTLNAEGHVHYVVFDLDTLDEAALVHLQNSVEYAVDPLGDPGAYECLLLEKSGGKGYHIWLFLDGWVPAYKVRSWLDQRFWPEYLGDDRAYDKLEVFPKQDTLRGKGLGNLVKLPLGVHAVTGVTSEIVDQKGWSGVESIRRGLNLTDGIRSGMEESNPGGRSTAPSSGDGSRSGVLASDGYVARLLRGSTAKGERNTTFYAFFYWCAWNVHLPDDLAWDWWERLNEALDDPETDEEAVRQTMESAYGTPPPDEIRNRASNRSQPDATPVPQSVGLDERVRQLRAKRGAA